MAGRSEELFPPGTVLTKIEGVIFRYGYDREVPRMLEVLEATFGRWPGFDLDVTPFEHLRWKMSPPGRAVRPMVFVDGDTIIGTTLEVERRYLLAGKPLVVFDGTDAGVLPAYQSRGLYSGSRRWMETDPLPTFAIELYTANPGMANLLRRGGCREPENRVDALAAPTIAAALRSGGRAVTVREVDRFDERIDPLFAAAIGDFDFIQVRNRKSLDWRYCDRRGGRFRTAIAENGDELLGFVVTKTEGTRGWIADLVAAPERPDALRALVAAALSRLRSDGTTTATSWAPKSHPYRRALRSAGFVNLRRPPNLLYRAMHVDPSRLEVLADPRGALHLMPGDFDWI